MGHVLKTGGRVAGPVALAIAGAAGLLAITLPAQPVEAQAGGGVWRCFANGNIPIGILTVNGANYRFQPVSNTAWRPNPRDRGNGTGAFASATNLTPVSGPLRTVYQITTGTRTVSATSGVVLNFGTANGGLLGCWTPEYAG